MGTSLRARLKELGHELPRPARSVGKYAGHKITGNQFWCVQGPVDGDRLLYQGRVGRDLDFAQAQACTRFVMLNILAQLEIAVEDDMDRVAQAVRLGGYICTTEDFTQHSLVMNAASELLHDVLGERGQHARFVAGCYTLPFNLAVEIEAVLELRP